MARKKQRFLKKGIEKAMGSGSRSASKSGKYIDKTTQAKIAKEEAAQKVKDLKKTNDYRKRHGQSPIKVESPVAKESPVSKVSRGKGRRTKEQRQADKRQSQPKTQSSTQTQAQSSTQESLSRKQKKEQKKQQQQANDPKKQEELKKQQAALDKHNEDSKRLDELQIGNNALGAVGRAFGTGWGSLVDGMKQEGAWKRAGIGMAQSAVASGVGHAGLAALQGEDPWEAAKTGAVRGALVGAGYQGLKVATAGQEVKGIKNTLKHIGSTSKQMYQAHTKDGNLNMRGQMSNQLKRVLEQNQRAKEAGGIFGLK